MDFLGVIKIKIHGLVAALVLVVVVVMPSV